MISKETKALPVPDLASAIEFGENEEKIEVLIRDSLGETKFDSFDVVILACTHYPLAYDVFRRVIDSRVAIFDPATAVAERVERLFWPREAGDGKMRFLISKDSVHFRTLVAKFFPHNAGAIEVVE
jgi:glutamate racemase